MKGGPEAPDAGDLERHEPERSEAGVADASLDPLTDPHNPSAARRAEDLLQQGEELFADGRYDEAIHVWTRIRFIDRQDNRARAAIDRGKRAVAERQRRLDVELVGALRLVDDGELEAAHEIVVEVLRQDPRHVEAHQLAERLTALDRRSESRSRPAVADADGASGPREAADTDVGPLEAESARASKRGLLLRVPRTPPARVASPTSTPLKMAGFVLGAILVLSSGALYLHLNWEAIVSDGAFSGPGHAPSAGVAPLEAPVPDGAELHFFNGERLYRKGRYREALVELSAVPRDAAVAESARGLILRIEQRLLRGAAEPETPARPKAADESPR